MNAGVLEALPGTDGPAIKDLIAGWYNNSNPLAGPATYNTFNQDYVPSTAAGFNWRAIPANQALYSNVFKHSCRVCHISRDAGKVQIGSFNELLGESSSYTSSCTGLGMPHSQRTWGIFWGSRGSKNLGNLSVPDMPTQLREALGETACPVLRAE